jgi:hypothetical protein
MTMNANMIIISQSLLFVAIYRNTNFLKIYWDTQVTLASEMLVGLESVF